MGLAMNVYNKVGLLPGLFPHKGWDIRPSSLCKHPENAQGVESLDGATSSS